MDDHRTWRELYDAHFAYVYRLSYSLGVNAADAEDLAQRVFLVVHDKLRKDPEQVVTHPKAWLRAITVRVVADHRRWKVVRRVKQWLVPAAAQATSENPSTPEERSSAAQAQKQVQAVLARMSPKLREVLVLLEIEELELSEVAELLGIPVNTVRSRKRLAREQFHALWRAEFDAEPSHG
ncbi:MAG: RNA polymerase sigma factor [Deltaproteobacteria bacterium]|nr:RNA polymerase sigma factor [Deltaproteobacteria bacterium]